MNKNIVHSAFNDGMKLLYKPKKTIYKLFSFAQIVDENNDEQIGLCYQSDDNVIYTRSLMEFEKFEFIQSEKEFDEFSVNNALSLVSSKYKHPHQFKGFTKIKNCDGSWDEGILFCCTMGMVYARAKKDLGKFEIENLIHSGIVL